MGELDILWLTSFIAFSTAGLPFIIEFIFKKIKEPETKLWKSIWSWIIAIGATYVVWLIGIFFDFGFLVGYDLWWIPLIFGVFGSLFANYGWNNVPWIKNFIMEIIKLLPKTKKEDN